MLAVAWWEYEEQAVQMRGELGEQKRGQEGQVLAAVVWLVLQTRLEAGSLLFRSCRQARRESEQHAGRRADRDQEKLGSVCGDKVCCLFSHLCRCLCSNRKTLQNGDF